MTQIPPPIRARFNPTLIACGVFSLFIVFAILTARCLYADGSYYFLELLRTGNFTAMIDCRSFVDYLFQLPVIVALALGIHGIPFLTILFGIGCFCAWPVAMFLCYRMAPGHFWLVMLACAAGYLNAAFMAVGEHIVAHAFFWPVLFAILFVRPLTPFAAVSLLASSIILMRSYESMLFLGPVLVGLLIWRMISEMERPWQLAVLGTAAVFIVVAIYVAWMGVKHPNIGNYNGFKRGFFTEIRYPEFTVRMSLLWASVMLLAMHPSVAAALKRPVGIILLLLIVLAWGLYPLFEPQHINPAEQYDCRFLDLLVPLALVPVALILSIRPGWLAAKVPDLIWLSAVMLVAQSFWHLSATYQWDRYVRNWKTMLAANSGPIFLPGGSVFTSADFSWVNPCESLVLGPSRVRAIVMPDNAKAWQPFNPLNPQSLPDLTRYGLNYTEYTASLKQQKVVHD